MEDRSSNQAEGSGPRSALGRTSEALDAVMAFIHRTARRLRKLSLLGMAAGALILVTIATQIRAAREPTTLALWALVLVASPAVLFVFTVGLSRLTRVRQHLRALPELVGERAEELRRLAGEARGAARKSWVRSVFDSYRFWRSAAGTRELLLSLVPARFVLAPWVLVAAFFAVIGCLVEIAVAPFAALWFLASAAF
ncbi:MAG TPA: hypothetical protein VHH54_02055 [Actinomycetota bacterium]|nr:hypothetical protein [Actinomycetota bacterium]